MKSFAKTTQCMLLVWMSASPCDLASSPVNAII